MIEPFVVWAVAAKDLRLLSRDRTALFWTLLFPVLFALFFGFVVSASMTRDERPVALGWVDEDRSTASRELEQRARASGRLAVEPLARDPGRERVRRGELAALLVIPAGYGKALDGGEPRLELLVDPRSRAERAMVRGALLQTLLPALPTSAERAELPATVAAAIPVVPELRETALGEGPARSPFELVFPAAVLWALVGCAATFAVSLVSEETRGTQLRLFIAPIHRASFLAGKALAALLASLFAAALVFALGVFALGVRVDAPLAALTATIVTALAFVGITVLLATFGRSEQAVAGASWATLILASMLGGAMVPLSSLPAWLQTLALVSPVYWGIRALETALFRGALFVELLVPCAVLAGFGAVGLVVGVRRLMLR